jgi:16S rRNA C967 or C1407 C5-methylase (RsmB/RsmF family)/NOL1/NOP2/fmu family ribosome biogenesis protein
MHALLGDAEATQLLTTLQTTEPVTSLRVNPMRGLVPSRYDILPPSPAPVAWCTTGYYLDQRPPFTLDPLLHAGGYYVQEASSMFLEQVFRQLVPSTPAVMLDLCAAPGGKSTHARALLPPGSLLVSNEYVRSRAQILAENLTKWGDPSVVVTHNAPADFARLPGFFDVLLADVPCSGEGMFRKDPTAVSEWSEAGVAHCRERQRQILADVWPALKPGGLLIYSTCTFNTLENEENVLHIASTLGADILPLDIPATWGITGNLLADATFPVYRFLPHKTRGEGFFLAVLRKHAAADAPHTPLKAAPSRPTKSPLPFSLGDDFDLSLYGDRWVAFPREHSARLAALKQHLRIVQAGVAIGQLKGKDFIPAHALAMSSALPRDLFPRVALSLEQSLSYLRHEAITLPPDTPRGYLLLTYQQLPLGFAKNIGNRANNLYPAEWRIRLR